MSDSSSREPSPLEPMTPELRVSTHQTPDPDVLNVCAVIIIAILFLYSFEQIRTGSTQNSKPSEQKKSADEQAKARVDEEERIHQGKLRKSRE